MSKKTLYSVAVERSRRLASNGKPSWYIVVSYFHADDYTDAKFQYNAGNAKEVNNYAIFKATDGRIVNLPMAKVIGIAPVVFVLEDDETGEAVVDAN